MVLIKKYFSNFKGFQKEIWILALMTFINRAGVMVVPFLAKYLKEDLNFTYSQIGWIMFFFGIGSFLGTWLGGKFADRFGFYKVMIFSLFSSGIILWFIQFITNYYIFCIGIFLFMVIADMFRPAMFVSIKSYADPKDTTRALSLNRLAINLGFSAGPAIGGFLITHYGYKPLFWIDSLTCILAICIFWIFVKENKSVVPNKSQDKSLSMSVLSDKSFNIFLVLCFILGILFFQIISTLPLFYKEKFDLTPLQIGLLITLNGLIIFFTEMPLVGFIEKRNYKTINVIFLSAILMSFSYILLLLIPFAFVLPLFIAILTFGEMLAFPFTNKFAMSMAKKGSEGKYLAIYSMSFSMAHVFSGKVSMEFVSLFDYQINWFITVILGVIAVILCFFIKKILITKKIV